MSGTFGHRPPFKILRVERIIGDEVSWRLFHCESGFWYGPTEPGETGEYRKERFTVDERFPHNSCSSNVSFWPQLAKAIAA